ARATRREHGLPPMRYRVSGGVLESRVLRSAHPVAAEGGSGSVIVEIEISETGTVTLARALSGPAGLRAASEAAAWQWQFKPLTVNGEPVRAVGTISFNFK